MYTCLWKEKVVRQHQIHICKSPFKENESYYFFLVNTEILLLFIQLEKTVCF